MSAFFENSAVATGLEKASFLSKPKKGNTLECSNYHTIALIPHTNNIMLKILQVRLQQYVNWELTDVQAGSRKGRGTRDQIASIHWIIEKAREFHKNIYFCFIDYTRAFDCVDHNKLWKILKVMGIPDHLTCPLICHSGYLTYVQGTSCKMLGRMKHKMESRLPGEISITSDMQITPPF